MVIVLDMGIIMHRRAARALNRRLVMMPGVVEVSVRPKERRVRVRGPDLDCEALVRTLRDLGYELRVISVVRE